MTCPGDSRWSRRFGGADDDVVYSLAVDGSDNVFLTGPLAGTVDFDGTMLATAGMDDAFTVALDAQGKVLYSQCFGDADEQYGVGVAAVGAGQAIFAGNFNGVIDFGGGALASAGGSDVFVAKLDATGKSLYRFGFGDASDQNLNGIAKFASGEVAVMGLFDGEIDFGSSKLTSTGTSTFVAKLDAMGTPVFGKAFNAAGALNVTGIAAMADGGVVLSGYFTQTVDFGGPTLTSAGGDDVFVARLDATGNHVWSARFGDAMDQDANGLAIDASGNILVVGQFQGTVDFGGGALTSAGGNDVFVAKLDASGAHLWSQRFGDPGFQSAQGVATDGAGNVAITGFFTGAVDFGGGALTSAGGSDAFVAKLSAAGKHLWSRRFGDSADQLGIGVSFAGSGDVVLVGDFSGTIDMGNGPLQSAGGVDFYVAKLAP